MSEGVYVPGDYACDMAAVCVNSPIFRGPRTLCHLCRLSPLAKDQKASYWQPCPSVRGKIDHPGLEAEKRARKAKRRQKPEVDRERKVVAINAKRAEKKTESRYIRSTRNSGRSHKDGDHVAGELVTLDTKMQSQRTNLLIKLAELAKVREDAKRAGKLVGGLVLRNANNIGVVVFTEADFALLMKRIENQHE